MTSSGLVNLEVDKTQEFWGNKWGSMTDTKCLKVQCLWSIKLFIIWVIHFHTPMEFFPMGLRKHDQKEPYIIIQIGDYESQLSCNVESQ